MKIKNFVRPTSLTQAYQYLSDDKNNTLIAGGAWLKMSKRTIENGIDLTALKTLSGITETNEEIRIGSMTTLRAIETHETLQHYYQGILPKAIGQIMGVGLRNLVTIGGNIMSKHGFSDIVTPLLVLPCRLEFHQQGSLSLKAFIQQKPIKKDILKAVVLEKKPGHGYFKKAKKTALDFALLNVAMTKDNDGIKIVAGSRPSIAQTATEAEAYLNQQTSFNDETIEKAVALAISEIQLGDNPRASKSYRTSLLRTYLIRGLKALKQSIETDEGALK